MPGTLEAFGSANPVTLCVDAARAQTIGEEDVTGPLLGTLAWLAGLLLVFVPLAVRAFRRVVAGLSPTGIAGHAVDLVRVAVRARVSVPVRHRSARGRSGRSGTTRPPGSRGQGARRRCRV